MKILTLNLRHDADRWPERSGLVVRGLAWESADVIGMQEVTMALRQAHALAERLNKAASGTPYRVYVESRWGADAWEGIAVLTRLPVLEVARLELPEGGRIAQRVTVEADGCLCDVYNTHLHHLPSDDECIRLQQVEQLLSWMAERAEAGHPGVLVGDFNATPLTSTVCQVLRTLISAYREVHGEEPVATFPTPLVAATDAAAGFAARTIDYIFVDPRHFVVQDAYLVLAEGHASDRTLYPSDHFGLAAVVRPRQG